MGVKKSIIFLFVFLASWHSYAQGGGTYMQSRILILLDKSSSMINTWDGGRQKSKVADEVILRLIDSIYNVNPDVEFSLRVFGHQYTVAENNCKDTRNEVPFHKDNRLQMEYRLDDIQPLGVTSIAYALQEAADNDLVDVSRNAYSIILITDGGESCGGDICEVMRKLAQSKVFFRPYIVNLESAPQLKTAYACMGDYLEVTRQGDIPGAVSKIVAAFRPVINITTKEYTQVKEVAATAPTVMNVKIPVVKITDTVKRSTAEFARLTLASPTFKPETPKTYRPKTVIAPGFEPVVKEEAPEDGIPMYKIAFSSPAGLRALDIDIDAPRRLKPKPVAVPPLVPVFAEEAPTPVAITRLSITQPKTVAISAPVVKAAKPVVVAAYVPVIIDEIPERPAPDKITRLAIRPSKVFMNFWVMDGDGSTLRPRKVPPLPAMKFDAVAAVTPSKTGPAVKIPLGKPAIYNVETEDATETTVEVYFTNGNGKFYTTTPQIMLIDPATGTMVRRFYRTVNGDGNPDVQSNIPPGTYHLTFSESRSTVVNNVTVEPNKRNKVYVTVNKASLIFEYANNKSRPVTEFRALVTERNKPTGGKIIDQKCTERLEYESGNYHVIINTFPQDVRNIDLEFDEKVITILQPGFAKFVAQPDMNSVTLYQRLGDKFMSFNTLSLKDPKAQHLAIQPGEYQAHYHKGPGGSAASEKVTTFIIKATEETEIQLN